MSDASTAGRVTDFIRSSGMAREDATQVWRDVQGTLGADLDHLYAEMLKQPELARLLGGEEKIARLKKAQSQHWQNLFAETLAADFPDRSAAIGRAHTRIGLSSRWYIATYGWLLARFIPRLTARHRFSKRRLDQALQTLIARTFLDMIMANSVYEGGILDERAKDAEHESAILNLKNLAGNVADVNAVTIDLAYLASNTREMTDKAQTIASAAAELVASVDEIARNSEGAASAARDTDETVAAGRQAVGQVHDAIRNIASAVEETAHSVDELSRASEQIGQILTVIEQIAGQTNLLALNATIEAARAGEAGRGFAVVASEVKNLATQTSKSTEDITQRIASLRSGMSVIMTTMQRSTSAVQDGQGAIEEAASTMDRIAGQVASVASQMQGIAGILHQQKSASAEVAHSVDHVAQTATENERLLIGMSSKLHASNDRFAENAKDWFTDQSHRALCEMAKIDHVLLKKRIVDVLMGRDEWTAAAVPDHHDCRLGHWYDHLDLPSITGLEMFRELAAPHARVHAAAKAALEAHGRGDTQEALAALAEMNEASDRVLELLEQLSARLHGDLAEVDRRTMHAAAA